MAKIISVSENPAEGIKAAVRLLTDGQCVAIPTETVYGLAADATNPNAVARIYQTKGRPQFNPLICHMTDLAMAERYAAFDPISAKLAKAFWPGPLTLVLPLREGGGIHDLTTAGLDTVGIRVPEGFAGALIRAFGRPLAAPSANTSGKISATSADHVEADLGSKIALILDAGPCTVGVESTIVKVDGDELRLLRPGGLAAEDIERVAGRPLARKESAGAIIEAPGMMASHYAPNATMRLNATAVSKSEALIRFGNAVVEGEPLTVFDLSPVGDLAEAATNLFDFMKRADASGATGIAVTPIPNEGLGEAINDRLQRAAAPRE